MTAWAAAASPGRAGIAGRVRLRSLSNAGSGADRLKDISIRLGVVLLRIPTGGIWLGQRPGERTVGELIQPLARPTQSQREQTLPRVLRLGCARMAAASAPRPDAPGGRSRLQGRERTIDWYGGDAVLRLPTP